MGLLYPHVQLKQIMTTTHSDIEFSALKALQQDDAQPRQRELAEMLGISLGMTNAILKRLAAKGYLTLRKVNGRNMQYAVTPEGTREIARRSYRYMRSTIQNISAWREVIDSTVREIKAKGASCIELSGKSELAFIVEHSCRRHGLGYAGISSGKTGGRPMQELPFEHTVIMYSETCEPPEEQDGSSNAVYLRTVLSAAGK